MSDIFYFCLNHKPYNIEIATLWFRQVKKQPITEIYIIDKI